MAAHWRDRFKRLAFNFFPAFRASGARITYLSEADRAIRLKLPLKRLTRNYVGTIYGGSMYSALDGILMVLFIRALGKEFIVWDKSGRIEYLKPARETLFTEARIDESELDYIRSTLGQQPRLEKEYTLEWRTADGMPVCRVHKLLYFRRREPETGG